MSDIYFSCLGCNALYKDIYEIEAHLLHDPCHEDDTQALYDSYGTAEYLHVMLSKIQMLISQSAEEADASREGSVTTCTWEVEERQWEEEDEIYNMLCAGIQDDETPRPHEDQVVGLPPPPPIYQLGILNR